MIPLVLICLLIGAPVLVALIFRVNAIYLFLSLAVGDMLVRYLSDDTILAVNAFTKDPSVPMIVRLILLLGPVVAALLMLKKSMPRFKVFGQFIPLWATGLAIASLAVPLLPEELQSGIFALPAGSVLRQSQDIIIAIAASMTLLLLIHEYRPRENKHGKARKHH